MRRLYVVPKSVWLLGHHACLYHPGVGSHFIDLVRPGINPATLDTLHAGFAMSGVSVATPQAARAAFTGTTSSDSNLILVCTDFHAEAVEDIWHNHPLVAVLPHPTFEGNDMIRTHVGSATKRITHHHVNALLAHPSIGFHKNDTVIDLARKTVLVHPQVKLRAVL